MTYDGLGDQAHHAAYENGPPTKTKTKILVYVVSEYVAFTHQSEPVRAFKTEQAAKNWTDMPGREDTYYITELELL